MPLEEYARKRKFSQTPEPGPDKPAAQPDGRTGLFCVQRHDATRLHYDFRVEVGGVLVSWAVPKGPTLDPTRKSLAMKVEDHPFDYAEFEGNIPEGNYGGGSVMLWDIGRYELLDKPSAQEQLDRGDFKFFLEGSKLRGAFALVRMKRGQKGNEWLLIKKPDEYAVPGWTPEDYAWSVKTRRSQEQIAANDSPLTLSQLAGAKKAPLPKTLKPMLATLSDTPPEGDQWIYELKWDGVRALCFIENGKLRMVSRNGIRTEEKYPEFHDLPSLVDAKTAVLDGEIVVLDEQGRSRFELIQPRISTAPSKVETLLETNPAQLVVFDLLYLDGYDLRRVPLENRKTLLEKSVEWTSRVRFSKAFEAEANTMIETVRKMGMEGVIAKDRHSAYESKRSQHWIKVKVQNQQEFVIGGFTEGEREYFGSLILGVWEDGKLRHVSQVGTGFDGPKMKEIAARLAPLVTRTCPFTPKPKLKGVTWVKPELVCEVRFHEWTGEGSLRAPVFLGVREDKPSKEVTRELPAESTANAANAAKRARKKPQSDKPGSLDLKGNEAVVEVDGRTLKLTNLNKVFYPKDGFTKRDVLHFYDQVSEWLIPHLKNRPLSLKRYPNGIHSEFFFQKNASEHFPDWLRREPVQEGHPPKTKYYVVADDRSSLLYLANLGCIDQNPWISRVGSLDHPDWVLIDLDPFECSFDRLIEAAQVVHRILSRLDLRGYPKTTGGDGLHVYIPVDPVYTYEQSRQFAELIFRLAEGEAPDLFTEPRSVSSRKKGKVYFDWLQIGKGKTISAPYVVRAYDGAPVSTPLHWAELKKGLRPTDFTIKNVVERFRKIGDIFAPVLQGGQRLEQALKKLT
jgi:bifunctional non-homologous end joining protein LigD